MPLPILGATLRATLAAVERSVTPAMTSSLQLSDGAAETALLLTLVERLLAPLVSGAHRRAGSIRMRRVICIPDVGGGIGLLKGSRDCLYNYE